MPNEPRKKDYIHDILTGGIEGAAGVVATDELIHGAGSVGQRLANVAAKIRSPLKSGLPRKLLIGGGVGALATGAIGAGVNAVSAARQRQRDNKVWLARRVRLANFASSSSIDPLPARSRLAQDRYKKQIREADLDRRDRHLGHALAAGVLAGIVAPSKNRDILQRAALGGAAGIGGVLAVRAVTAHTKDIYGERSRGAKQAEGIPTVAALGAAGVLARRRLKHRYGFGSVRRRLTEFRALDSNDEDLRRQRRALAAYAGGAALGVAGLALALRRRPAGVAVRPTARPAPRPAGRGTLERQIAAKKIVSERGYVNLRPMDRRQANRFAKAKPDLQNRVRRYAGLATNPNLSPGERQKMRQAVGKLRATHNFGVKARLVTALKRAGVTMQRFNDPRRAAHFSAFIKDIAFKDLPGETQKNIRAFLPGVKKTTRFPHYGMVAKELTGKADPHNLATARKHLGDRSEQACAREVHKRLTDKFVLVNNDKVVDGHHFISKAERGKVSRSLHVIDLTPARFQLNFERRRALRNALTEFVYANGDAMPLPDWVQARQASTRWRKRNKTIAKAGAAAIGIAGAAVAARKLKMLSDRRRVTGFRREQLRESSSDRWADPRLVAIGAQSAYAYTPAGSKRVYGAGGEDLPVAHAQVLRKVYNDAGRIRKNVGRTHALLRDAADVVAGRGRRTDDYGRPQKREWEKSWFKHAATDAAIAGASAGGLLALKRNPALRRAVLRKAGELKKKVNRMVPDFFAGRKFVSPVIHLGRLTNIDREIAFDAIAQAVGWDIRDPRGRSVRVFHPEAKPRTRRSKEWYEKEENRRKIRAAIALTAAPALAAGGFLVGRRFAPPSPAERKIVPVPWVKG